MLLMIEEHSTQEFLDEGACTRIQVSNHNTNNVSLAQEMEIINANSTAENRLFQEEISNQYETESSNNPSIG